MENLRLFCASSFYPFLNVYIFSSQMLVLVLIQFFVFRTGAPHVAVLNIKRKLTLKVLNNKLFILRHAFQPCSPNLSAFIQPDSIITLNMIVKKNFFICSRRHSISVIVENFQNCFILSITHKLKCSVFHKRPEFCRLTLVTSWALRA